VKKLGIALGVLVVLLIAAIAIIPMVVDVDKYRPQVVSMADEQLNGKLELGKLSLSLWGQVRVEVGGLKLTDLAGHDVVSVNNAYFHIPFWSLLMGSPEVNFKMESPNLIVVKDKAGKLNVAALMKSQGAGTGAQGAPAQPSATAPTTKAGAPSESIKIPGIAARARLGLELLDATVNYKDEGTGLSSEFKNLNFVAHDLSLSHPSKIQFWSDLNTTMGKSLTVKGPAKFDGDLDPSVSGGKLDHLSLNAHLDLDDLEITIPGTFEKKKGVPANAEVSMTGSEKEMKIEKINIKFFNAEIKSSGTISNLENPATATVQYEASSNAIDLKSWNELLPMLKAYELAGTASFNATVGGQMSKLTYQAKLKVEGLTAKAPNLKAEPRFDATIDVTTDQIQNLLLTMKAPGNDLTVKGKVLSFNAPQANFDVTSTSLDLDQLVEWPAKGQKAPPVATGTAENEKPAVGEAPKKAEDAGNIDAMLDPLRSNPIALKTSANVNVDMKMIRAQGVKIENLQTRLTFKDLVAAMDNLSLRLFSGAVKSNFAANLKPKTPTYHFTASGSSLDLNEAVASQMASLKNTVIGKASFDSKGEGSSFNPDPAKANLKMNGSLKVLNAEFTSIDVGKMTVDALMGSLGSLSSKVPGLGGKQINPPSKSMKYDSVSSNFGVSNGTFSMPDFVAKATPNQGIDLKGSTQIGLKDLSLKADWQVIDTYNLTHAKDISVNQSGLQIDHILAEGNGPVQFPVSVGCTIMQPCYKYGDVASYLGKVALNNLGSAAKGQLKSQAGTQLQKALGNNAPPAIKDKLKHLFGQ
jgi:uncharacterized protein involved in outer membrane biogenesis